MCAICDKRFAFKAQLAEHSKTHTGIKPYVCAVCGKACSRSADLRTHMRLVEYIYLFHSLRLNQ